MNKIDVILDSIVEVITHVRGIADSLQMLADAIGENKGVVIESKAVEQIADKAESKPKKAKAKTYSLEDVRGVLAEKSQAGFSAEVKELITKYGADRLSTVDPAKYEELIKDAEGIGIE